MQDNKECEEEIMVVENFVFCSSKNAYEKIFSSSRSVSSNAKATTFDKQTLIHMIGKLDTAIENLNNKIETIKLQLKSK